MFNKILVANRGEIALRVIRAARELGVETVAVYSEADRFAPHVAAADEAYLLGPAQAAQSYLNIPKLIEVARKSGAEAVHPGYGFLAERAPFIREVEGAGLTFIGPSAEAVEEMGDKTAARQRVKAAGVPIVPGTEEPLSGAAEAAEVAESIGYPILLKAAAGGGGKGMRVVRSPEEIESAWKSATGEARSSFGDDTVYIEKYLEGPRHIEIQVLADTHGNTLHLGERECSIQRRHQKMIEEAPSPILSAAQRQEMGATAVAAAESVGYRGAGTVEFLWHEGEFYFLEMNTRIQVEHPVTELVTGVDLVQWQIRVAAGEPLPFNQSDISWTGHSIECRITSEDPRNSFLPSTGSITDLVLPSGPGIRWDGGITLGFEVGLFYDPMLGKLIVHAPDRLAAIERMKRALDELRIGGIETSIPFHVQVMDEQDFREGNLSILYLEDHADLMAGAGETDIELVALTAALLAERARQDRQVVRGDRAESGSVSNWKRMAGWRR